MKQGQGFAGFRENRLKRVQPLFNPDPANRGNLFLFPTGQRLEAVMLEHGDDAGHCSNGLSTKNYREATLEDRSIYRKWVVGMVVFYSALLLLSGVVAIAIDANSSGQTRLTNLSAHPTAGSHRSN
jgi:hypothetical protein